MRVGPGALRTAGKLSGPAQALRLAGLRWLRSWPLLDPGREQVYDLNDARRAQLWPPGGGVDPAKVGPAVELGQRVEERRGVGVGLQGRGDVVRQIAALRAFRGQLEDHVVTGCDARIAHPHRRQDEHPSATARHDPAADPPAVHRPGHGMLGFGTPRLVRVKRHRDNRAAPRTSSNAGTEPLNAHDPHRGTWTWIPAERQGGTPVSVSSPLIAGSELLEIFC